MVGQIHWYEAADVVTKGMPLSTIHRHDVADLVTKGMVTKGVPLLARPDTLA